MVGVVGVCCDVFVMNGCDVVVLGLVVLMWDCVVGFVMGFL